MSKRKHPARFNAYAESLGAKRGLSGAYELPLETWLKLRETIASTLAGVGANARPSLTVTFCCQQCGTPSSKVAADAAKAVRRGVAFLCSHRCVVKAAMAARNVQSRRCHVCDKPMTGMPRTLTVCSAECRAQSFKASAAKRLKNRCINCGCLVLRKRTCSPECLKAQNAKRVPHNKLEPLSPRNCGACGVLFVPKTRTGTGQYCSRSCASKGHSLAMAGEKNPSFRHGLGNEYGKQRDWFAAKKAIWDRDAMQCVLCQSSDQIEVHHINMVPTDHRLTNLACLCKKCHRSLHSTETSGPTGILSSRLKEYAETATFTTSKSIKPSVSLLTEF